MNNTGTFSNFIHFFVGFLEKAGKSTVKDFRHKLSLPSPGNLQVLSSPVFTQMSCTFLPLFSLLVIITCFWHE